jgi:hypothetical protein
MLLHRRMVPCRPWFKGGEGNSVIWRTKQRHYTHRQQIYIRLLTGNVDSFDNIVNTALHIFSSDLVSNGA